MPPRRAETARKPWTLSPTLLPLGLALAGWLCLVYLAEYVHPTVLARAIFLALWGMALLGTAWPVLLALYRRFRSEPSPWTVWRQSAWCALFGTACAWLQMNRLLKPAWAMILAGVFVVIEVILHLRDRQEASSSSDDE